jgi:hypothetical protein
VVARGSAGCRRRPWSEPPSRFRLPLTPPHFPSASPHSSFGGPGPVTRGQREMGSAGGNNPGLPKGSSRGTASRTRPALPYLRGSGRRRLGGAGCQPPCGRQRHEQQQPEGERRGRNALHLPQPGRRLGRGKVEPPEGRTDLPGAGPGRGQREGRRRRGGAGSPHCVEGSGREGPRSRPPGADCARAS